MIDDNKENSLFEDVRLIEAIISDRVSAQEYGDLYFGRSKTWDIAQENVAEELRKGKYRIFERLPDYDNQIDLKRGVAVLNFYSEMEKKLIELTYAWIPNASSEDIIHEVLSKSLAQFNQEYARLQEQIEKYPPGQVTISLLAKPEFYTQFAESAED